MAAQKFCLLRSRALLILSLAVGSCVSLRGAESNSVLLVTIDETNRVVPCRIHLRDASGKAVKPPGLPFWSDHFVCTGVVSVALAPATYTYEIERGPEYRSISNVFTLGAAPLAITNRLQRIVTMRSEGWWPGEFHVHRNPEKIEMLMAAEDLHFAHVITWWNESRLWKEAELPGLRVFDKDRFYHLMGGEDERGGGALLYLNLDRPLDITGSKSEFPSSAKFLLKGRRETNCWVDVEKPFWWDVPLWLATAPVDSIGIANNHHHRSGMLDNEAWGKPRDTSRWSTKHGVGLWTQEIYFHILNAGFRVPPSAGSASGVLPNPVGYNRAYVHLDGAPSWEKWHAAFREGKVFVSNGPLLRCRANGKLSGHVFKSRGPTKINLEFKLDSRDPIRSVELIQNGRARPVKSGESIEMEESGWFLVRAIADLDHTFRFACTGPWYVEIADSPQPGLRESAQFFHKWTEERLARIESLTFDGKDEVVGSLRQAETFWKKKSGP